MKLKYSGKLAFFEFLQATYPKDNILKDISLNKLLRQLKVRKVKLKRACLICQKEIDSKTECKNPKCTRTKKTAYFSKRSYKDPKFINFDIREQLTNISEKNWLEIVSYKSKKYLNLLKDNLN
jgi:hypothetical protein